MNPLKEARKRALHKTKIPKRLSDKFNVSISDDSIILREKGEIMEKQFNGILVRKSGKHGCGIVEMISHKCVICYFEVRDVDGEQFPELKEVHDRLLSVYYDRDEFWRALTWGRKLAEVLVN